MPKKRAELEGIERADETLPRWSEQKRLLYGQARNAAEAPLAPGWRRLRPWKSNWWRPVPS